MTGGRLPSRSGKTTGGGGRSPWFGCPARCGAGERFAPHFRARSSALAAVNVPSRHWVSSPCSRATIPPRKVPARCESELTGVSLAAPDWLIHVAIEEVELLAQLPDAAAERVEERAIAELRHAGAEVTQAAGSWRARPPRPRPTPLDGAREDRAPTHRGPWPQGPLRAAGSSSHRRGSDPPESTGPLIVANAGSHSRIAERYALRASQVPEHRTNSASVRSGT